MLRLVLGTSNFHSLDAAVRECPDLGLYIHMESIQNSSAYYRWQNGSKLNVFSQLSLYIKDRGDYVWVLHQ